jgi:hypothetical protein
MDATHIADQVLTASTALAGLLLVAIGANATAYESYDAQSKPAVWGRFARRGWLAFAGFALSIFSALSALVYYWHESPCLIDVSAIALGAALSIALFAALISAMDIR